MEYRKLKINVILAEGLKDAKLTRLYCQVSIAPGYRPPQKTFINKDCGTKPPMEFVVDETNLTKPGLFLFFHVKIQRSFLTDKEIGSFSVPLEQLFKGNPSSQELSVEYQVSKSGKANGILRFAYSFDEKFTQQVVTNPALSGNPHMQPDMNKKKMLGLLLFGEAVGYNEGYQDGFVDATVEESCCCCCF